uniref:Uncharacterized protein n=1 Tax=Arundo donax TaxID=35708 RepID=A0A0A9FL85_ARUDO
MWQHAGLNNLMKQGIWTNADHMLYSKTKPEENSVEKRILGKFSNLFIEKTING